MKYCAKCGNELLDEAVFCMKCGVPTEEYKHCVKASNGPLSILAKVFMIVSTVFMGFYLIPLAWCIPLTVIYFTKKKNNEPISIAFKVCSLIFVSLLAGIFMLIDEE